jgi:hypothetical protein
MTPNLFSAFKEAADMPPRHEYLKDGTHDLRISNVETVETQDGATLLFLEYTVLQTKGTTLQIVRRVDGEEVTQEQTPHEIGETVKQSLTLTGPAWRKEKSMKVLKRLCTLGGHAPSNQVEFDALMGVNGADSPIIGDAVRITGVRKVSEKGTHFTDFAYMASKTTAQPQTLEGDEIPF